MAFSLLSRYYPSFSPEVINDLSTFQFHNYMNNIAEIEKMFHGGKEEEEKEEPKSNEELVQNAKRLGLKTPKKY